VFQSFNLLAARAKYAHDQFVCSLVGENGGTLRANLPSTVEKLVVGKITHSPNTKKPEEGDYVNVRDVKVYVG